MNEVKIVAVNVLKAFDLYFPGDICGLSPEYAEKAISLGFAEKYVEPVKK